MINLFKLSDSDMSLVYLTRIFGSMNGFLPGEGSITMFSTMFATFNGIILAVAAVVIVYVTVVGVIGTAHEGEFLGKKYNNIWLPIRTVLGVATLVPTASGYSAIQYLVMWIVVQGIGAADTIWSTTLSARAILGTPYGDVELPSIKPQAAMANLFQGLVCDATARITSVNPAGADENGKYYCAANTCSAAPSFNPDSTSMQLGPNGLCGTLSYCNAATACTKPDSLDCLSCQAQLTALESIVPTLSAVAQQFAQTDYMYRDFYYNSYNQLDNTNWQPVYSYCSAQNPPISQESCCRKSTAPGLIQACQSTTSFPDPNNGSTGLNYQSPSEAAVQQVYWPYALASTLTVTPSSGCKAKNFVDAATCEYMGSLTMAFSKYIQLEGQSGDMSSAVISIMGIPVPAGQLFQMADQLGWIFGGTFYYLIATEGGGKNMSDALPPFDADISGISTNFNGYRTNVDAVSFLLSSASEAGKAAGGGMSSQAAGFEINLTKGQPKPIALLLKPIEVAMNTINQAFNKVITATGGPLNGLAILGQLMTLLGAALYVVVLVASFLLGTASLINVYVVGSGMDSPFWGGVFLFFMFLAPAVFLLIGWLIGCGVILSVYLPLIPFIVFMFGAIGWFMAVIEAMVAAPIVALGILSPSQQGHELLGKAEPAIGMMLNIFLRPSLMLFGMIAAMLLAVVVVEFLLNSFGFVMLFVTGGGVGLANPIVFCAFITVFIGLVISVLNKCFTLIHIIPSQVLQWIGIHHQPATASADEALGEAKTGVKGVGERAGGSAEAQAGRAKASGKEHKAIREASAEKGKSTLKAKEEPSGKGGGGT